MNGNFRCQIRGFIPTYLPEEHDICFCHWRCAGSEPAAGATAELLLRMPDQGLLVLFCLTMFSLAIFNPALHLFHSLWRTILWFLLFGASKPCIP